MPDMLHGVYLPWTVPGLKPLSAHSAITSSAKVEMRLPDTPLPAFPSNRKLMAAPPGNLGIFGIGIGGQIWARFGLELLKSQAKWPKEDAFYVLS